MFDRSSGLALKATFALVALIAVGAVDFMARHGRHGPGYGPLAYVSDLSAMVGLAFDPGRDPQVAALMPEPPEGWIATPFHKQDLTQMLGRAPAPVSDPRAATILALDAAPEPGIRIETRTYRMGDGPQVLLALRHRSGAAVRRIGEERLDADLARDSGGFAFARIGGLDFAESRHPVYDGARRFAAHIGRQVDIELVSTADDAAVLALLERLDIAALNAATEAPVPGLGQPGYDPESTPASGPAEVAEAASSGPGGWFSRKEPTPSKGFSATCARDKGFKRCSVGD